MEGIKQDNLALEGNTSQCSLLTEYDGFVENIIVHCIPGPVTRRLLMRPLPFQTILSSQMEE